MIWIILILTLSFSIMFLCGEAAGYNEAVGEKRDTIYFVLFGLVSAIFLIFEITTIVKVEDVPTLHCSVCEQYYEDDFVYCPIDGVELEEK